MRALLIIIALMLSALPAWAQSFEQNRANCSNGDNATTISACTAVIQSGQLAGPDLAVIYLNRGGSYYIEGHYAQAIADLNQAIALKPVLSIAFYSYDARAHTYEKQGLTNQAIADYRTALKLASSDPTAAQNPLEGLKRLGATP
jgi:tetratricopeptide (TPR) repeat protein